MCIHIIRPNKRYLLMKRRFFLVVTTLAAATLALPLLAKVMVDQAAPDFTLTDSAGKSRSLSEFKGKTVVLEWNNPECPFVMKHYESGNIPKQQTDATATGIVWLTIGTGRTATAENAK